MVLFRSPRRASERNSGVPEIYSAVYLDAQDDWLTACYNPHYSRRLLLQPPIRGYDKPDGGWARRSVGQRTVTSMPPSLRAPRARLAWRLGGFR
jgi:hypothetical protein